MATETLYPDAGWKSANATIPGTLASLMSGTAYSGTELTNIGVGDDDADYASQAGDEDTKKPRHCIRFTTAQAEGTITSIAVTLKGLDHTPTGATATLTIYNDDTASWDPLEAKALSDTKLTFSGTKSSGCGAYVNTSGRMYLAFYQDDVFAALRNHWDQIVVTYAPAEAATGNPVMWFE